MRFVESCDFREFSAYLAKLGQYTAKGELDGLKRKIESGRFNLIVFRENDQIIGHAIWHETNTEEHERANLEKRKTGKSCKDSWERGKTSSSFMNCG